MDIDSSAACFGGQSVVGSKSGGVVSKKRTAEPGSARKVKKAARKGSNVAHSNSEDTTVHEDFISEGHHVEVESVPEGTSSPLGPRSCSDSPVVEGIEIAPGVRSIIRGPRPPIQELTEPEGEPGWSTLDIRTRSGLTGDGPKPFDTLKAFKILANTLHYRNMDDAEFYEAYMVHNAEAFSLNCAMKYILAHHMDRADKVEAELSSLTSDLQRVKDERDAQLVSFRQLEAEKARMIVELATVRVSHARELEDIRSKEREAIESRDAEIARLMLNATEGYRKHMETFVNTQGCSSYVTKKGSPAFHLGYTALEEFIGEDNVYTSRDHVFMRFVADRQAKKVVTGGDVSTLATCSSREMVSWDGDSEFEIPLDDLISYDRSFDVGKDVPEGSTADAGSSKED